MVMLCFMWAPLVLTSRQKYVLFVKKITAGNHPEVSLKTSGFVAMNKTGDVLTSHQKHHCFVAVNSTRKRPQTRQQTS